MADFFYRISSGITRAVGSPWALLVAFLVIVVWATTGPIFHFSDTWQLVINTGTTIVTFLMVFVIQASQNREAKVTQLKLDELIRALQGARDSMIALEEAPEDRVQLHAAEMKSLADVSPDEKLDILQQAAETARSTNGERPRTPNATSGTGSSSRTATRD